MEQRDNNPANIQDSYLGRARKDRALLTVFLNSGKKIVGRIRAYDRYTVILEDRGNEQMIFKHAISTISAARSFSNPIPLERSGHGREETRGVAEGAPSGPNAADPERTGDD